MNRNSENLAEFYRICALFYKIWAEMVKIWQNLTELMRVPIEYEWEWSKSDKILRFFGKYEQKLSNFEKISRKMYGKWESSANH